MDDDQDFKAYYDNFIIICNEPENNEVAEQLLSKAKSSDANDFRLFLIYNMNIFRNPEKHPSALYYSAILILNAFRSSTPNEIKDKWFDPNVVEIQQDFKNTIITGLQNEDLKIRNVCSTIIASIAYIEDTWQELCGMLIDNIKEQNLNQTLGSIHCLSELFALRVIHQDEPLPDFMMELIMILSDAIKEESLLISSRTDACQALIKVLEQFPCTFDTYAISHIVQNISQSLEVEDLYSYLFSLLIELVKKNYEDLNKDDSIIENIKGIIHNEIQNKKGYFKCVSIDFLNQLSDFEKDKNQPVYSCSIAAEFVEQLLGCLIEIEDPENRNPEDPLKITSQITAANTLQSLYNHNSQVIFTSIRDFFNKFIGSQNWIEVHAAIFSVYALCQQSNEIEKTYSETVKEFIDTIFPLIIIHAGEDAMCLRTKETSMWIISSIIESYPMIDEDTEDGIPQLLTLFENSMNIESYPMIIIIRACRIFKEVARRCNTNYLDSNFQKIVEIILTVIQNMPLTSPTDALKPFVALDELIRRCTNSCEEQISELMNILMEILQTENIPPLLSNSICYTIATILKKIDITPPVAESLVNPFIKIIEVTTQDRATFQRRNPEIDLYLWEGVFYVLANIIDLNGVTNSGIALIIANSIFNALDQDDLELTKTALKVLGKLYNKVPPDEMEQYLDSTFDIVTKLITSAFTEIDLSFTSSVIYLYANIFMNMGSKFINFAENKKHSEALERIDVAWRGDYQSENQDDVLNLFITITFAYKCLVIGFSDEVPFLKIECKKNIFEFIKMIYETHCFNDNLLDNIFNLLSVIKKKLKKNINILMNRKYVLDLVEEGTKNRNNRIAERAKYLANEIPKM